MKCNEIQKMFPDYLLENLNKNEINEIEKHLKSCTQCAAEFEHIKSIWEKLGKLPDVQPSLEMNQRFYNMLEAYKQGLNDSKERYSIFTTVSEWWNRKWIPQPVFQLALLAIFLFAGFWMGKNIESTNYTNGNIEQLHQEMAEMRQIVSISLLNQQSPGERLRGLRWSRQISQPNESLISALLKALNKDPNVNVRLAAIDALYLFSDRPAIRSALTESLAKQTSPLVQISLIDLLVNIKERKALETLKILIHNQEINPEVQKHAQWGVNELS